jgi:hypothetical protein
MRRSGLALLVVLAALPAGAQVPDPGATPAPSAAQLQRRSDTRTQSALRRVLGVLMEQYGDLTGNVPQPLNDADIAMREAGRALDAGDDATAAGAIQRAIEALQKGGRSMSQQLAQQFGRQGEDGEEGEDGDGQMAGDQDGSQPGDRDGRGNGQQRGRSWSRDGRRQADRRPDDRRDPLGRPLREDTHGQSADESGVRVPDEMEQARAHAIQEELRRRGGEKTRPQLELDYIDRLLKQF